MIKGIIAAVLAAFVLAAAIVGIISLFFSGMLLAMFGFIAATIFLAAILLFIIIFVFALIVFFALFYFMAEKKPEIKPGNYSLNEEKEKN
jgi:phosphotransferase system  glucose/maltose/N-acetylglucosamine-specific IIC component